jgi:hypothetical protein
MRSPTSANSARVSFRPDREHSDPTFWRLPRPSFHILSVLLGSLIVLSPGAASAQDFSVQVEPTSLTVASGATAHVSVNVGWIAPFTSEVTIATPTYPDVTFTPPTFVITQQNWPYDLAVNVLPGATQRTISVPITGTYVYVGTHTAFLNLTIGPPVTPGTGADLEVKVVSGGQTPNGMAQLFTINVRNLGPEAAAGVKLGFTNNSIVPFTVSGTIPNCSGTNSGGSSTCEIGALAPGDTRTISFSITGQYMVVRATITATTPDPVSENNYCRTEAGSRPLDCVIDGRDDPCAFQAVMCSLAGYLRGGPTTVLDRSNSAPGLAWKPIAAVRGTLSSLVAGVVDFVSLYRLRDEVFVKTAAGRRYTELFYTYTAEVASLVYSNASFRSQFASAYSLWIDNISSLVSGQGASAIVTQAQVDGLTGVIEQLKILGSPELKAVLAREQAALNLPSLVGKSMDQALAQQQTTAPATVTIPAAASIHGIAPAFFHSDLRVFNPSTTTPVTVTAQFRCFTGPCPANAARSLTVAPREMKVYGDVIATLFGAPETAGPIELTGAVLAESRVYTPSLPAPTTGSDVPGLSADEAYAASVLLSLSKSADSGQGFRTNVGVYNPNAEGVTFVVTLYGPGGVKLGDLTRSLGALSAAQVNDVFAAAGITSDVPDAYAIVASDGGKQLFAYATVVDNQSQDSVFVKGRNGRGDGASFVTVPAVASIHGVGSSFFHSDVKVFNASTTLSEDVTLRYRCFTGPCPAVLEKTITVAPREMKVLNDVIATLFGGPETAGAIELLGNVLVDSRVYTPNRPLPTTGTGIPGEADVEATTTAALLSLSYSANGGVGFRTNLGVFNPDALSLDVTISLRRPDGTQLATLTRTVPAKTSVQVNDVFGQAGVTADVPAAYALVAGDGLRSFFAYATVVDNQSQDSVFVKGRSLSAP